MVEVSKWWAFIDIATLRPRRLRRQCVYRLEWL